MYSKYCWTESPMFFPKLTNPVLKQCNIYKILTDNFALKHNCNKYNKIWNILKEIHILLLFYFNDLGFIC